jgi:hypothetical protein
MAEAPQSNVRAIIGRSALPSEISWGGSGGGGAGVVGGVCLVVGMGTVVATVSGAVDVVVM